jgi:hypothetical protein
MRKPRRGSRLPVACAAVAALALAPGAFAQEPDAGTVGGPPTFAEFYEADPGDGSSPRGEPLVIGTGRTKAGRLELVAYESRRFGLCVDTWLIRFGSGGGACGGDPRPEGAVEIGGGGMMRVGGRRYSRVEGFILPEVARLEVTGETKQSPRRPRPVVAQVDAELAARIGQPQPFGYFAVAVVGCVEWEDWRAVAFDAAGTRIGRSRGPRFQGLSFCKRPELPPPPAKPDRTSYELRAGR